MSLVKYSEDYKIGGYTVIDNAFITQYLSEVPDKFLKVYLYGMYLLNNSDTNLNTVENLTSVLKITEDEAFKAFCYFEECGILEIISKTPLLIQYFPLNEALARPKKFKPSKYADFSKQVQALLPERNISTAEFSEYYNLIETYRLQPEALIVIISYCTQLKGKTISYRYILTVAKNWVSRGILTLEACENELAAYNKQATDISDILSALGKKDFADYLDNELYTKWVKEWSFSKEAIIFAAKYLKKQKGNMSKLDELLLQFYNNKKMTEKEMIQFLADLETIRKTAYAVVKALGLYIPNISPVIDNYITQWFDLGYSGETLVALANYFFKSPNKKSLQGMNHLIRQQLFKRGIISLDKINAYIEQKYKDDKLIRQILEALGVKRDLYESDFDNYDIWKSDWKISDELILFAAVKCKETLNPVASLHRLLISYKNNNVVSIPQAEKIVLEKTYSKDQKTDKFNNYPQREYTKEELSSLVVDLYDLEEL